MVVDRGYEDFLELRQREVRRTPHPRTPVNKAKKKRKGRRPNTEPRLLSFVMRSSCS
jgi:hypothetical protein